MDVNGLKVSFNILPVIGSYYSDAGDKINDSAIFLVPASENCNKCKKFEIKYI